jgi:hypothetical protein
LCCTTQFSQIGSILFLFCCTTLSDVEWHNFHQYLLDYLGSQPSGARCSPRGLGRWQWT